MKINLNDSIQVSLTDEGRRIIRKYVSDIFDGNPKQFTPQYESLLTINKNGFTEFPVWEFCNIFGPYCYMGVTTGPFVEDNNILFQGNDSHTKISFSEWMKTDAPNMTERNNPHVWRQRKRIWDTAQENK